MDVDLNLEDGLRLVQCTTQDAKAVFELIDSNRVFWAQHGETKLQAYLTVEALEKSIRNPLIAKRYHFLIWDKDVLVGIVNLEFSQEYGKSRDVSFCLGFEFQGKGYIKRTVEPLMEHIFNQEDIVIFFANVKSTNTGGVKALERLGFTLLSDKIKEGWLHFSKRRPGCGG